MNIGLFTQFYPPEIGAPQSRLGFYAEHFARCGHRVEVVTSLPSYPFGRVLPPYRPRAYLPEPVPYGRVLRTWSYCSPNRSFVRRLLNFSTFNTTACLFAFPRLAHLDVLFVECPSLLNALTAHAWSALRGIPVVLHISDAEIQALVEFGFVRGPAARLARAYEAAMYRRSAGLVTVTDWLVDYLGQRGVPEHRILLAPNGVDCERFVPAEDVRRAKQRLGWDPDKWICLYAGTHGHVHGIEQIVRAAARLRDHHDIEFVFVGEGVAKKGAQSLARQLALTNIRFLPAVPLEELPRYIQAADVGLSTLVNKPMAAGIKLVKAFTYMACAIPQVASDIGENGELIRQSGAGICVPPEDDAAIADALLKLRGDAAAAAEYGRRGREYVVCHYNRRTIAQRVLEFLQQCASRHRRHRCAEDASCP